MRHALTTPSLKSLVAFASVAKHLSFTKAADELCVTHSAISQSIAKLEHHLGHKLICRNGHTISLNENGQQYAIHIRDAITTIQMATSQQLSLHDTTTVTINIGSTLALRWLIPQLTDFQQQCPNIDIRISTLTGEWDFIQNNIDAAIVYGNPSKWAQCESFLLFQSQLILVSNKKIHHKKTSIQDIIHNHQCIYVKNPIRKEDWNKWCEHNQCKPPVKNNRMHFSSSSQGLQAVSNGLGIMVTHAPFVMMNIKDKALFSLGNPCPIINNAYYLVYPKFKNNENKIIQCKHWLLSKSSAQAQDQYNNSVNHA